MGILAVRDLKSYRSELRNRYQEKSIDCELFTQIPIKTLSDFFLVLHGLFDQAKTYWFRGLSRVHYNLVPGALRYAEPSQRTRALALVDDLQRVVEYKLAKPPQRGDVLGWMFVAQHYGLPTRLLDWTHNAAAALFFACYENLEDDGGVVLLNPLELNQAVRRGVPRIFNSELDRQMIEGYFRLGVTPRARGAKTIAINPAWNNERIILQQGAFTLHGDKSFGLNRDQASSLVYIPILKEFKQAMLIELERVGISEMFIYPEPEHVCRYLRAKAGLN